MRLLYISLIVLFATCVFSCKNDSKLPEFSLEELKKREHDSVKQLLSISRVFYAKQDYENTILTLEDLISRYATYSEVLEAQEILDDSKIKLIITKIREAINIQSVIILLENNVSQDIAIAASDKIENLIKNVKNIEELEDYLNQNKVKEHTALANNKIKELKELAKQNAYANAVESENSKTWKQFLEDYPNHPNKDDIEKTIIMLEVSEIFNGEYGEIPASLLLGDRNNSQSEIDIKNNTKYTLTLRYSGKEVKKVSIAPFSNMSIKLKSGIYRVAASVNASNVRNFAGQESLFGEYSSSYYISTTTY